MTDAQKLKTTLMAGVKKINKKSAIEAIVSLMNLHDIKPQDFIDEYNKQKSGKKK